MRANETKRDVYGDSVDKVVQGNTSNIVFLKSTDDSMLDTLQKMSGVRHKAHRESKTVTKNKGRLFWQNEDTVTYTVSSREEPVISYNDMAFISERQSIVFRAGDSPVWNRNEMILPMSWRLFQNTIVHSGHDYSLQTIPTLSSALDFDVRKNQPDFSKMLDKRMDQARYADTAKEAFQSAYGYTDYEMEQLDPDNLADEIMGIINSEIRKSREKKNVQEKDEFNGEGAKLSYAGTVEENKEQIAANERERSIQEERMRKIYAGKMLSMDDLVPRTGLPNHQFDKEIIRCYVDNKAYFERDTRYFMMANGNMYDNSGRKLYIAHGTTDKELDDIITKMNRLSKDDASKIYAEADLKKSELKAEDGYIVSDDFIRFLVSVPSWSFANGFFEKSMASVMSDT